MIHLSLYPDQQTAKTAFEAAHVEATRQLGQLPKQGMGSRGRMLYLPNGDVRQFGYVMNGFCVDRYRDIALASLDISPMCSTEVAAYAKQVLTLQVLRVKAKPNPS